MTLRLLPGLRSIVFAALVCALPSVTLASGKEVKWERATSLLQKNKHEKPVLVRFFAHWCGPCRVMDLQVWRQPEVIERVNRHFTPLEIDIDRSDVVDVLRRFGIASVPTILVLDQNGRQVARSGFADADQLLEFLKNALIMTEES